MGYWRDDPMPGVSVFKRQSGGIVRASGTSFSPGDDFRSAWHFRDLIPEGAAGWEPNSAMRGDSRTARPRALARARLMPGRCRRSLLHIPQTVEG